MRAVLLLALTSATAFAAPVVDQGAPTATGDLDKEVIRSAVNHERQKLQYCYEKELLAKGSISGHIDVKFMISPNGTVASSEATGFDKAVGDCVASVIKGIAFPKPKSGGVQVNYPFDFRPDAINAKPAVDDSGAIEVKGDLDKPMIQRYVRRSLNKIQYCYEKNLLARPGIQGQIIVEFVISLNGTVERASATGFDAETGTCLADIIKAIEFPKPKTRTEVRYPFNFKSAAAPPSVDDSAPIEANGDIDKDAIRRAVLRARPKISGCYEKSLATHPGTEGSIVVTFIVVEKGTVLGASASGFDAAIGRCLEDVIKGIAFPAPHAGRVEVRYPFSFKKGG